MAAGDVQVLHWQDTILSNLDKGYANTTGRTIALREFPSALTESNRVSLLSDGFNPALAYRATGPYTQGGASQGPGVCLIYIFLKGRRLVIWHMKWAQACCQAACEIFCISSCMHFLQDPCTQSVPTSTRSSGRVYS